MVGDQGDILRHLEWDHWNLYGSIESYPWDCGYSPWMVWDKLECSMDFCIYILYKYLEWDHVILYWSMGDHQECGTGRNLVYWFAFGSSI